MIGRGRIILIIFLLSLSGCSFGKQDEPVTLTINYPSEQQFYQMYAHDFEKKYPYITIKVINQDVAEQSVEPSTDVIFIDHLQVYNRLIDEGKLINLESNIHKTAFPISELSPIVVNSLRSELDGGLYGLSPSFISHALYYNKDLFERYGIPLPKNQMTWQEIFDLAGRFPNQGSDGERIYGFKSNYYTAIAFSMILRVGQTEGLQFINPESLKVNFQSDEWKTIFSDVIQLFRYKVVYDQEDTMIGEIEPSPMLTGRAAMEIQSYSTAYNFDAHSQFVGAPTIKWGLVTVPVATRMSDQSDYYNIQEIYGISSTADHAEEAWKLIEFITGDIHKMKANVDSQQINGLPARTELIRAVGHHDLSPLYVLNPVTTSNNPYDYVHDEILNAFKVVGQSIVEEAIQNSLSVDEAIHKIEIEGQRVIDETNLTISTNSK